VAGSEKTEETGGNWEWDRATIISDGHYPGGRGTSGERGKVSAALKVQHPISMGTNRGSQTEQNGGLTRNGRGI